MAAGIRQQPVGLAKRAGSPGRIRYGIRESGWRGVFPFVGGKKVTLGRLFCEKGIVLTAEAGGRFDVPPDTFLAFIAAPERFFARPEAEAA